MIYLAVAASLLLAGGAVAQGQLTGRQIKNNTITGKDVRNKSLTKADFRGSARGPRGLGGPQGAPGPSGPAGPSALSGITPVAASGTISAFAAGGGTVPCPEGQRVVSGGYENISADGEVFVEEANADRTGYTVLVDNLDSSVSAELTVIAYCAGAGQAVAARDTMPRLREPTGRAARLLRRQQALHRE